MNILGIETTCDETACAIVQDGAILSNQIASQVALHEIYGGVVPEIASREHAKQLLPLLDKCLKESKLTLQQLDLIGVAYGPGLIGPLLIGVNAAKILSKTLSIPLLYINHIEAHLFAAAMHAQKVTFPALGVVLSGGHTALVKMNDFGSFELLGETRDDAIGESFDKVAKMMNLAYPGGPIIEKLAEEGDPNRFDFKAGRIKDSLYDFSFSGIKTKVLYSLYGQNGQIDERKLSHDFKCDIAASFQKAVFEDVVKKTLHAAKEFDCKSILFGGGVTNSKALRNYFKEAPIQTHFPTFELTLDNAAMIAGLAEWQFTHQKNMKTATNAQTRIPFLRKTTS